MLLSELIAEHLAYRTHEVPVGVDVFVVDELIKNSIDRFPCQGSQLPSKSFLGAIDKGCSYFLYKVKTGSPRSFLGYKMDDMAQAIVYIVCKLILKKVVKKLPPLGKVHPLKVSKSLAAADYAVRHFASRKHHWDEP